VSGEVNELGVLKLLSEKKYPNLYCLLNTKARKQFPLGLSKYLEGGSSSENERDLSSIERALTCLVVLCGEKKVYDKYRKDMSGTDTVNQVAELFCEIALCAFIGRYAQELQLRPAVGNGK